MSEINIIQTPAFVKEKINAKLPSQIIQKKPQGNNKPSLSYISGSTVIDILNSTFGYLGWNFEIVNQWMQEATPWVNKYNNNTLEEQNPIAFVHGRLTVFVEKSDGTIHTVVKESFGSKSVVGKQNEQESTFKAAQTDALKKCASLIGIGAELYRKQEEQEYFDSINLEPTWSEEMISKHQESYDYLKSIIDTSYESKSYVDECVAYLTGGAITTFEYIPEDKIKALYDMVSQAFAGGEEE